MHKIPNVSFRRRSLMEPKAIINDPFRTFQCAAIPNIIIRANINNKRVSAAFIHGDKVLTPKLQPELFRLKISNMHETKWAKTAQRGGERLPNNTKARGGQKPFIKYLMFYFKLTTITHKSGDKMRCALFHTLCTITCKSSFTISVTIRLQLHQFKQTD